MEIHTPWDRLPDETDNSYRAFTDYKNLGVKRSLSTLFADYQAATSNDIKPPTLSKKTLHGWCYKFDWVNRVTAWDNHLIKLENDKLKMSAEKLFDHELADYELQRNEWLSVYANTPMFKQTVTAIEDDPENPGQKIKVITVRMNTADWLRLSKWRDSISMQGRRALNLPERITKQEIEAGDKVNDSLESAKQLLERLLTRNLNPPGSPDVPKQSDSGSD